MDDTILDDQTASLESDAIGPLDWFTKSQAAATLQVSEKTIERLATKGDIRRATRKRPGVRPLPVYDPDDLQKIKDSQIPRVEIISQAEAPQQRPALVPRADLLPSLLQTLFPSDLPLRDKLFLTIKEAARFAGLPQATIRRLIHAAAIPAVKAGGWRIKRSDLEQLDSRHFVDLSDKRVLNTQNKGVRR